MAAIQFYSISPGNGAPHRFAKAFKSRLKESQPNQEAPPRSRALSRLGAVTVSIDSAPGVTLLSCDTPENSYYAPMNPGDLSRVSGCVNRLAKHARAPLRQNRTAPSMAVPSSLTPGAMVDTPQGPRPVETLKPGDMVNSCDAGPVPLRWVGRSTHVARGGFAPIVIRPGAFGIAGPNRALPVSPQQKILLTGTRSEALYGRDEVLVPAGDLPDWDLLRGSRRDGLVTYFTLMTDTHQLIRADGLWVETFYPADVSTLAFDAVRRADICAVFPCLHNGVAAYGSRVRQSAQALMLRNPTLAE